VQVSHCGANSAVHFILQFALPLLFVLSRGVRLNQITSEDRVEAVLEKQVSAERLELSEVTTELFFELIVGLPLLVLKSSQLLRLRNQTSNFLLVNLFLMLTILKFNTVFTLLGFILCLLGKVLETLYVFGKLSLLDLLFDLLLLQLAQHVPVPLCLCFDVQTIDRVVDSKRLVHINFLLTAVHFTLLFFSFCRLSSLDLSISVGDGQDSG